MIKAYATAVNKLGRIRRSKEGCKRARLYGSDSLMGAETVTGKVCSSLLSRNKDLLIGWGNVFGETWECSCLLVFVLCAKLPRVVSFDTDYYYYLHGFYNSAMQLECLPLIEEIMVPPILSSSPLWCQNKLDNKELFVFFLTVLSCTVLLMAKYSCWKCLMETNCPHKYCLGIAVDRHN